MISGTGLSHSLVAGKCGVGGLVGVWNSGVSRVVSQQGPRHGLVNVIQEVNELCTKEKVP